MQRRGRFLAYLPVIAALVAPAVARATDITDLPITQTLTVAGLSAPVDVVRDSHGIPHVYASNAADAAFALGYVHATDRLFQMDIFRRIPSGTVMKRWPGPLRISPATTTATSAPRASRS